MLEIQAGFVRTIFVCRNHRQKFRSGSKTTHYQQILGNQDYENLKFDRSPDDKDLAVGRANKGNVEDIGLWVPRPFIRNFRVNLV